MKNTTTLILLAVVAAGVGVYMNMNKKKAGASVVKKGVDGFYPAAAKQVSDNPMVENYEVNQRTIFAGGDYRNTPLPVDADENFVRS